MTALAPPRADRPGSAEVQGSGGSIGSDSRRLSPLSTRGPDQIFPVPAPVQPVQDVSSGHLFSSSVLLSSLELSNTHVYEP